MLKNFECESFRLNLGLDSFSSSLSHFFQPNQVDDGQLYKERSQGPPPIPRERGTFANLCPMAGEMRSTFGH